MKTKFGVFHPDGSLTNVINIDLNRIDSDDPIAYAYGLFHGSINTKLPNKTSKKYKELASEYIRGFNAAKKDK